MRTETRAIRPRPRFAARGLVPRLLVLLALASAPAFAQDSGIDDGGPTDSDVEASAAPDGGVPMTTLQAIAGHLLLEVSPEVIRVTEVFVLMATETIAIPEAEEPWLSLPSEAQRVQLERGEEAWRVVEGGLSPRAPLEPGRYPLALSYLVPADGGRSMVVHSLPFPVAGLHVIWPAGTSLSVRAMGFTDGGTVQVGGRRMRVLERTLLERGRPLVVVTSPQMPTTPRGHAPPQPRDPTGRLRPVTLVLAGLILVGGLLLPVGRRRRKRG